MKFDCIVGNPPYGVAQKGSTPTQHLKIMKNSLSVCSGRLTFIMPSKPIVKRLEGKWYDMFRNAVCHRIEVMSKDIFPTTEMDNTAIYYCDRNEDPANYCKLLDAEENLYKAVGEVGRMFVDKMDKMKSFEKIKIYTEGYKDENEFNNVVSKLKDGKYYLNVNRAGIKPGFGKPQWLSGDLQKIGVLTKNEEIDFCKTHTRTKSVIECPTKEYGENIKYLMTDGLVLRYALWLQQRDQHMRNRVYKYVPHLDYACIRTDEELLAACGFTTEETKTVLDYLKNFDFSQNRNDLIRNFN